MEIRVLAVADVVEAMSSHHPYRPSLGLDKALDEIVRNRGVFYDRQVVDACVGVFKEDGFSLKGEAVADLYQRAVPWRRFGESSLAGCVPYQMLVTLRWMTWPFLKIWPGTSLHSDLVLRCCFLSVLNRLAI